MPSCPGDGNIDFVVDQKDLDDWGFYSRSSGLSSVYDLNIDGLSNAADQTVIDQHLGLDCRTTQTTLHSPDAGVRTGG